MIAVWAGVESRQLLGIPLVCHEPAFIIGRHILTRSPFSKYTWPQAFFPRVDWLLLVEQGPVGNYKRVRDIAPSEERCHSRDVYFESDSTATVI